MTQLQGQSVILCAISFSSFCVRLFSVKLYIYMYIHVLYFCCTDIMNGERFGRMRISLERTTEML